MFFHISPYLDIIEEFTPHNPSLVYTGENKDIKRICVSKDKEGCLTAVPWGGRKLEGICAQFSSFIDSEDIEEEPTLYFRVYEFDESDIKEENLINTETLLKDGLVMDAEASDEHWIINQNIKPTKTYIVGLISYDEEPYDVFTHEYHQVGGDVEDLDEHIIGFGTKITNINYKIVNESEIPYEEEEWKELFSELREANFETDW